MSLAWRLASKPEASACSCNSLAVSSFFAKLHCDSIESTADRLIAPSAKTSSTSWCIALWSLECPRTSSTRSFSLLRTDARPAKRKSLRQAATERQREASAPAASKTFRSKCVARPVNCCVRFSLSSGARANANSTLVATLPGSSARATSRAASASRHSATSPLLACCRMPRKTSGVSSISLRPTLRPSRAPFRLSSFSKPVFFLGK
mmetsp:Transcript_2446/g.5755  ORF Transcript_2446/g.5755 Transcript_2446/m.5755 type:complete len:207 (+) Transcript_2446:1804-2424(+)